MKKQEKTRTSTRMITLYIPEHERIGQFMFNFLSWLKQEKGYGSYVSKEGERDMADPFFISDDEMGRLTVEYIISLGNKH